MFSNDMYFGVYLKTTQLNSTNIYRQPRTEMGDLWPRQAGPLPRGLADHTGHSIQSAVLQDIAFCSLLLTHRFYTCQCAYLVKFIFNPKSILQVHLWSLLDMCKAARKL